MDKFDKFSNTISNRIKNDLHLGVGNVKIFSININNKDLVVIKVRKLKNPPAYFNAEFYVRNVAADQKLTTPEAVDYLNEHKK